MDSNATAINNNLITTGTSNKLDTSENLRDETFNIQT